MTQTGRTSATPTYDSSSQVEFIERDQPVEVVLERLNGEQINGHLTLLCCVFQAIVEITGNSERCGDSVLRMDSRPGHGRTPYVPRSR